MNEYPDEVYEIIIDYLVGEKQTTSKMMKTPSRLMEAYPNDLQEIIIDYLVGEKKYFKRRQKLTIDCLKKLISNWDYQKFTSYFIACGESDIQWYVGSKDPRSQRLECLYNQCYVPATLNMIFKRINNKKKNNKRIRR